MRESLTDHVYSHLRAQILNAALRPGDRIGELEVARELGLSQGPIRKVCAADERRGE